MSNAEHLIENAIFAMKEGHDLDEVLDHWPNDEMLRQTGIRKADIVRMAEHVVYSLYDGCFPGSTISLNKVKEMIEDGSVFSLLQL